MPFIVYQLGLIEYSEAYRLQRELLNKRLVGEIGNLLLLLEHPPVFTIGKSGSLENVLVSREQLAQRGIALFFIDRGGDVTYHGPGQIVGYPIIDLKNRGRNLRKFVHDLEEVLIRTLSEFSIESSRDSSHRGVWTGGAEIAAIGLRVVKWVSMHGFALNVNTDLAPFRLINPCGLAKGRVTSMSEIRGTSIPTEEVTESILRHFSDVFD